jgi:uncharacterized protein YkwD
MNRVVLRKIVAGEAAVLSRLNRTRSAAKLSPLRRVSALDALARRQASRMAGRGHIFHSVSLRAGVPDGFTRIGENVASSSISLMSAQDGLEKSKKHYANMVTPEFNEVGIGIVKKGDTVYLVQLFVAR